MRADLVCGVGCSFTKTNFAVPIPPGKRLVHLTNDEDAINKDYRCDVPVLGDAKLVLQQLLAALHAQAGAPRAVDTALHEEIRATKAAWLAQWMPKLTATDDAHQSVPGGVGSPAHRGSGPRHRDP